MLDRDEILKHVSKLKTQHGIQDQDEHVVATLHLMNTHRLDLARAQDQTSHGSADRGVDAWHYDAKTGTLLIYQSKLSTTKSTVLKGLDGLLEAANWIADVLRTGQLETKLSNTGLYNLARCLDQYRNELRCVLLHLISPFDPNELLDYPECDEARHALVKSPLNEFLTERNGRLDVQPETFNLKSNVASAFAAYEVSVLADKTIPLGKRSELRVCYVQLASLVELFRRRGNRLFEKNVRLYLNTKESRQRLEHPLEDTLERICTGQLEPNIFPFFHIGVTITAGACDPGYQGAISLEAPNIINGCQTVNIADRYLRKIEKEKSQEKVKRFQAIPVLAKVVVAANGDQIREIANCNNRQNPIDAWQLFSNDPVHVQIESAFLERGIFYERQKGKFDAEMRVAENLNRYFNTNGTKITVEELGQLITLCRRQLQLAAKPSEIYSSKQVHDETFDWTITEKVHDAVWSFNAFKAVKRGLRTYLQSPSHDNETSHSVFSKPLVRNMLYYLAIMSLYQGDSQFVSVYGKKLNKKCSNNLGQAAEGFFRKVISKTKTWYLGESQQLKVEVSWKKLETFCDQLCNDIGLDSEGPMPFTQGSHDWSMLLENTEPDAV